MCRPIRSLLLLIIACGTVIAAEPDSEKRKAAAFELSLAYNYVNFIVDYDKALAEIEEALALDPTLADAYRLRAYVHWQQGKLAVALKDADEAIRLGPKQALCYSTRATILAKAGQPKRAIHDYCLALKFDPNRAWDYCGRGMARASLGNYSNAIDDLKSRPRSTRSFRMRRWNSAGSMPPARSRFIVTGRRRSSWPSEPESCLHATTTRFSTCWRRPMPKTATTRRR